MTDVLTEIESAARAVTDDIVARIIAHDAERDALIADLVLAVKWYGVPRYLWRLTTEQQDALERALAYVGRQT